MATVSVPPAPSPTLADEELKPGARVYAKFRDGTEQKAVIISRSGGGDGRVKFYVHYINFNRRLDTWVPEADVRYDAEGDAVAKAEAAKAKAASASKAAAAAAAAAAGGGAAGKGKGAGAGKEGGAEAAEGDGGAGVRGVAVRGGGAARRSGGAAGAAASSSSSSSSTAASPVPPAGANDVDETVDEDGTVLRGVRRDDGTELVQFVDPDHSADGMTEEAIREHEEITKVKNVNEIELGRHRMEVWYFSPLPKEYWPDGVTDCLYFCEFCLKFFRHKADQVYHAGKCVWKHPPGDEIYRGNDGISMWEVDGAKDKVYCQNLSYLAKMFLDHKTLYYDVDLFFFYVMTERDEYGYHVVGYFSKEKLSEVGYNLACILALPCYQRKGYGRLLIQFSYELSKIEGKVGSPEKPLSDLGLLSYRSYWSWVLTGLLRKCSDKEVSIMELAARTSIKPEDITSTMQYLGMLKYLNGTYVIVINEEAVEKEYTRLNSKPGPVVDPSRIHWAPHRLPGHKKDKWLIVNLMAGGAAAAGMDQ